MQAIVSKYAGPTNRLPGRLIVTADAGRLVVPWDHSLNVEENHRAAIMLFVERYGWPAEHWHVGSLPTGAFVAVHGVPRAPDAQR